MAVISWSKHWQGPLFAGPRSRLGSPEGEVQRLGFLWEGQVLVEAITLLPTRFFLFQRSLSGPSPPASGSRPLPCLQKVLGFLLLSHTQAQPAGSFLQSPSDPALF